MRKNRKIKKRSGIVWRMHKQYGGMSLPVILVLIAVLFLFLLQMRSTPGQGQGGVNPVTSGNPYCRPDSDPNPPTIETYNYRTVDADCSNDSAGNGNCSKIEIFDGQGGRPTSLIKYVRLKKDVPITEESMTGYSSNNEDTPEDAGDYNRLSDHFRTHDPYVTITPNDGNFYSMQYPDGEGGNSSYSYPGSDGTPKYIRFADYKLIFLVHTKKSPYEPATRRPDITQDKEYVDIPGFNSSQPGAKYRFWITDIYIDESKKNSLPKDILDCTDVIPTNVMLPITVTPVPTSTNRITEPPQNKSPDNKQLQLQYIIPGSSQDTPGLFSYKSWWTPQCKPAIYLYPEQDINVHVSVSPKGFLTYTDPKYPDNGWDVLAHPNGTLTYEGEKYPYLYYESKIHDAYIQKPDKGYVVQFNQLESLYKTILPELGLKTNETKEFIEYWTKALPLSPYYFVGVMDEKSIDAIEPLQISPKPARIIRVRVYFEALDTFKFVEAPVIRTKTRTGFTVVEWGGMVKLHPGEEFTCSQ